MKRNDSMDYYLIYKAPLLITKTGVNFIKKYLLNPLSSCLILLLYMNLSYGNELYFLCGPDEDGCYDGIYQYCACIPYDEDYANTPYCFNFDELICTPLSHTPNCDPTLIFKNQTSCLGMIYQSTSEPGCTITTHSFCLENNTSICDPNGRPESCR